MAITWSFLSAYSQLPARSVRSLQAATEVPPVSASEGVGIIGVDAISIWITTETGETFTADTGQLDIYQYDAGLWGIVPRLALLVPPGTTGQTRVQLGTMLVDNPRGKLCAVCNGLSVSGGSVYVDLMFSFARGAGKVPV